MIMANHWVARKIASSFSTNSILRFREKISKSESKYLFSLLRLHPPPKRDKFEELKHCARARGWLVDTSSNKTLADSLDR